MENLKHNQMTYGMFAFIPLNQFLQNVVCLYFIKMKDVYNACDRYSSSLLYGKNSRSNIKKIFAIGKEKKKNYCADICIYMCV